MIPIGCAGERCRSRETLERIVGVAFVQLSRAYCVPLTSIGAADWKVEISDYRAGTAGSGPLKSVDSRVRDEEQSTTDATRFAPFGKTQEQFVSFSLSLRISVASMWTRGGSIAGSTGASPSRSNEPIRSNGFRKASGQVGRTLNAMEMLESPSRGLIDQDESLSLRNPRIQEQFRQHIAGSFAILAPSQIELSGSE